MSNINFFSTQNFTFEIPEIQFNSSIITKKTNSNIAQIDSLIDSDFENAKNFLNFEITFQIYDLLKDLEKTGLWYNNKEISEFLRFKIAICDSEQKENLITKNKNIFLEDKDNFILSLENLKQTDEVDTDGKTKFILDVEKQILKERIEQIDYLSVVFFSYYDLKELSKKYNLQLSDTLGLEDAFSSTPVIVKIIQDGNLINDKTYNYTSLEDLYSNLQINFIDRGNTKQDGYFSNLFASYDNFSLGKSPKQIISGNIIRFGFFFDFLNFLRENSIYGNLIDSNDTQIRETFLNNARILEAKFIRYKEGEEEKEEIVCSSINNNETFDTLYYKFITDYEDLLFLHGFDYKISTMAAGKYKYRFNIKIEDPAFLILSDINKQINKYNLVLTNYLNLASLPIIDSQIILDENPHIDSLGENYIGKIKTGFYLKKQNRFTKELNNFIEINDLNEIVSYFIRIYKVFIKSDVSLNIDSLEKAIKNSILPDTGNPEGVMSLINNFKKISNNINEIISLKSSNIGKQLSPTITNNENINEIPDFLKLLNLDIKFDTFIADSSVPNGFGKTYFNADTLQKSGLSEIRIENIENSNFNQFLKSLTFANKKTNSIVEIDFSKILQDPIIKNSKQLEYAIYASIDFLLNSYGKEFFLSVLNYFQQNSIQTVQETFIRLFSVINILNENNITSDSTEKLLANLLTNSRFAPLLEQADEVEKIKVITKFYDSLLLYKLGIGIINNFKIINEKTLFENKIEFYNKENSSPIFVSPDSSEFADAKLIKTSKFKIVAETVTEIYRVTFEKNNEKYLLKNPIFEKVNANIRQGEHLCFLKPYINREAFLDSPVYEKINIHNNYFIINNSAEQAINSQLSLAIEEII